MAVHFGRRKAVSIERSPTARHDWEAFGFDGSEESAWDRAGFDAFEAALAHGDGFTYTTAVHSRRMLHKIAADWRDAGLDCVEGLGWHQAGFTVTEALKLRERDHDVD
jgi:hypothetical protein